MYCQDKEEKTLGQETSQEQARLSEGEYRLMDLIWEKEPISAMELASLCLERFDWKKSTVYTMLKRLGDKKVLLFENKMVTSLITKDHVDRLESQALLERAYGGSISNFFAAFLQDRKLTTEEVKRLQKMIEEAAE